MLNRSKLSAPPRPLDPLASAPAHQGIARTGQLAALFACVAALSACGGGDDGTAAAPSPVSAPTSLKAQVSCSSLNGQTIPASAFGIASGTAVVSSATLMAATAAGPDTSVTTITRTQVGVSSFSVQ